MLQRIHVDADRLVGDLVGFLDIAFGGRGLFGRLCFLRARLAGGSASVRRGRCFGSRRCRGACDFDLGLAEGALEIVERDFAGTQRALQHLVDQRARVAAGWRASIGAPARRRSFDAQLRLRHCRHAALDHRMQLVDQIVDRCPRARLRSPRGRPEFP